MRVEEKAKLLLLGHDYTSLLGDSLALLYDLHDNCNIPEELQVRLEHMMYKIEETLNEHTT